VKGEILFRPPEISVTDTATLVRRCDDSLRTRALAHFGGRGAEFPLLVRALAEAGARVILVPSCTDTFAGYSRVKVACAARALENQCYVVQAPTVGEVPWSPAVDTNVGSAGFFGPPDLGFPGDGVMMLGPLHAAEWIFGDIDLQRVDKVRSDGAVLNHAHWREQPGAAQLPKADVILLD
jgi:predicted amidohydrolase